MGWVRMLQQFSFDYVLRCFDYFGLCRLLLIMLGANIAAVFCFCIPSTVPLLCFSLEVLLKLEELLRLAP